MEKRSLEQDVELLLQVLLGFWDSLVAWLWQDPLQMFVAGMALVFLTALFFGIRGRRRRHRRALRESAPAPVSYPSSSSHGDASEEEYALIHRLLAILRATPAEAYTIDSRELSVEVDEVAYELADAEARCDFFVQVRKHLVDKLLDRADPAEAIALGALEPEYALLQLAREFDKLDE